LGRLLVSRNKNVNEHTIKNKLPNTHLKSFSKNMKKLKSKKLIGVYRNENWAVTQLGRVVNQKLVEKSKAEKYGKMGLRVLLVIDNK